MSNSLIMFHANCPDGFCASWICREALQQDKKNVIQLVPINYDYKELNYNLFKGKDVYILDFSFKKEIVSEIINQANKLVLLDHHQTAEQELKDLVQEGEKVTIRFDKTKSGAMMTWEYFYNQLEPPELVKYIQDRDLWKFQLYKSRQVNKAIHSYDMDYGVWDDILVNKSIGMLAGEGECLLNYTDQLINRIISNKKLITLVIRFEGSDFSYYNVPLVNTSVLQSEVGEKLALESECGFSLTYYNNKDNKSIFSLRSTKDGPNVAEIAKIAGGGGHKNAAGFTMINVNSFETLYLGN